MRQSLSNHVLYLNLHLDNEMLLIISGSTTAVAQVLGRQAELVKTINSIDSRQSGKVTAMNSLLGPKLVTGWLPLAKASRLSASLDKSLTGLGKSFLSATLTATSISFPYQISLGECTMCVCQRVGLKKEGVQWKAIKGIVGIGIISRQICC